jgi:hypothetical protein
MGRDLSRARSWRATLVMLASFGLGFTATTVDAATTRLTPPLATAIVGGGLDASETPLEYQRIASAGANTTRIIISWRSIAPKYRPASFDPTDPADPAYLWTTVDRQVQAAKASGLEPLLSITAAPFWALGDDSASTRQNGTYKPDPVELGRFAAAIAKRYSGSYEGLSRVRYWQVWNEPNLNLHLTPQRVNGSPFSPGWYREMVNHFAQSVHAVRRDNLVIAGGLSPFTVRNQFFESVAPLDFLRRFLCLSAGTPVRPTCKERAEFDVWSHHPYTTGGPTHHAYARDDVSLGDLPKMRRVLNEGLRLGRIVHTKPVRFWVTEFSWDSNPPDRKAVSMALLKRWVPESLYRMWRSGVTLVTWAQTRDEARPSDFQGGLWFRGATLAQDRPKPIFTGFRFPFVAFPQGSDAISFWGRTPDSTPANVTIEERRGSQWKRVSTIQANRFGIFMGRYKSSAREGWVRARIGTTSTLPFSLVQVPDRPVSPFGI